MTKQPEPATDSPALQACEIEITDEMIEAGVTEAREHTLGEPLSELARKVYLAMEIERQASASASAIIADR